MYQFSCAHNLTSEVFSDVFHNVLTHTQCHRAYSLKLKSCNRQRNHYNCYCNYTISILHTARFRIYGRACHNGIHKPTNFFDTEINKYYKEDENECLRECSWSDYVWFWLTVDQSFPQVHSLAKFCRVSLTVSTFRHSARTHTGCGHGSQVSGKVTVTLTCFRSLGSEQNQGTIKNHDGIAVRLLEVRKRPILGQYEGNEITPEKRILLRTLYWSNVTLHQSLFVFCPRVIWCSKY